MIHKLIRCLIVCLIIGQFSGCSWWPFKRTPEINAPVVFEAPPTAVQLAEAVNANSSRVHQLESQVKVSLDGLPGLTGNLALEKPHRFRLQANLLGVSGLGTDVGSNDDLFWVWIKTALPGQSPTLLYARHAEFAVSSTRQVLPIEPAWIRDALGLTEINPYGQLDGPYERSDGQFEIRSRVDTPSGPNVRVLVIHPKYGWVTEQSVYNAQGILLAVAKSSRHRYYPEADVSLPQRVEVELMPNSEQAQGLTLDLGSYNINRLSGDPARLWAMPDPDGVQKIDLAGPVSLDPAVMNPNMGQQPATGPYPVSSEQGGGYPAGPYPEQPGSNPQQPYVPPATGYQTQRDEPYRPNYRGRFLR